MSAVWAVGHEVAWTDQDDRIAVLGVDRLSERPVVFAASGDIWPILENPQGPT